MVKSKSTMFKILLIGLLIAVLVFQITICNDNTQSVCFISFLFSLAGIFSCCILFGILPSIPIWYLYFFVENKIIKSNRKFMIVQAYIEKNTSMNFMFFECILPLGFGAYVLKLLNATFLLGDTVILLSSNIIVVLYIFHLRKKVLPKYYLSASKLSEDVSLKTLEKEIPSIDLLIGGIVGLIVAIVLSVALQKIYIIYIAITLAVVSITFILAGLKKYKK